MLEVDFTKKEVDKMSFGSLEVGATYYDNDGYLCIKTSECRSYEGDNCLVWIGTEWEAMTEDIEEEVRPIKTKMIVLE